jgi:hypothetical protein
LLIINSSNTLPAHRHRPASGLQERPPGNAALVRMLGLQIIIHHTPAMHSSAFLRL